MIGKYTKGRVYVFIDGTNILYAQKTLGWRIDYEKLWKGNMDVELTIDVMKRMDDFDTCILCSGDGDFFPLIHEMKSLGKQVVILSTRGHVAQELRECECYIDLNDLKGFLCI